MNPLKELLDVCRGKHPQEAFEMGRDNSDVLIARKLTNISSGNFNLYRDFLEAKFENEEGSEV